MISRLAAALIAALWLIAPAASQSPNLSLNGKVKQPQYWTLDDLRKMPAQRANVSYLTERGQ